MARKFKGQAIYRFVTRSVIKFQKAHPDETLYGFSLVATPEGNYVCCAFATEEGLTQVAQKYVSLGYRVKRGDAVGALRRSLRWANPDDGWFYYDPSSRFQELWLAPYEEQALNLFDDNCRDSCLWALLKLQREKVLQRLNPKVIVGFTYGSDPADFVESAKDLNEPELYSLLLKQVADGQRADKVILSA